MNLVRLDDVSFGDSEIDAAFRRWREAIERANAWEVSGHTDFEASPAGYVLTVKGYGGPIMAVVATGGISARSGTTKGSGNAVLYPRDGGAATTTAGATVKVYSSAAVAIPSGTTIEVLPEPGRDYTLIFADYCPP